MSKVCAAQFEQGGAALALIAALIGYKQWSTQLPGSNLARRTLLPRLESKVCEPTVLEPCWGIEKSYKRRSERWSFHPNLLVIPLSPLQVLATLYTHTPLLPTRLHLPCIGQTFPLCVFLIATMVHHLLWS